MAYKNPPYTLYRIFYGDQIVYVGRTNQPLQNRIRGHLFAKPLHRTLHIDQITKFEYSQFESEADRNLYEIYYILQFHPPFNVDDKTKDHLTVSLPDVVWKDFQTPLWEKWRAELHRQDSEYDISLQRYRYIPEELRILRSAFRTGDMSEEDFYRKQDSLKDEQEKLRKKLFST